MKRTKKFKKLTENEKTDLSNLEFFLKHNSSLLNGGDIIRMEELTKRKKHEDELAKQKWKRSLRDEAYIWF